MSANYLIMTFFISDGYYSAKEGMIEALDAKRLEFSIDIFKVWIKERLKKYDVTPGMLVSRVRYCFCTTGYRFDTLRAIAEDVRKEYYREKAKQF